MISREYIAYLAMNAFRRIRRLRTSADDFDWKIYHYHYQAELDEIKKMHTLVLSFGDYIFSEGALVLQRDILPLHPNHRLLYETILQLVPRSVIESGCGGGDHLHNLSLLAPNVSLHGCDLSTEQLALLQRRHPDLDADVFQADLTLPWSNLWPIANLCFTQAVIMHIHTGNNHLVALTNMFRMATQHVVLMENWKSHNFMDIIRKLYDERRIPWSNLYIYYRISPELNKPHMMIVSSVELDYEPLTKYETMLG